ncbi:MAG TPA: aldehyde dehydrogenase family protein [Aldersonia sp.]
MTTTEPKAGRADIEIHNPADGTLVGHVPVETPDDVAAKVRELRLFQPQWEAIGPRERKEWLLKYQDWVLDNTEHIMDVLQSETGKTRADTALEPLATADLLKYWSHNAEQFLAERHPKAHSPFGKVKKLTTAYRPYPVVGVITPWNFPFLMPAFDVIPALAAGAAVLLKPSEVTPLSAVEFVRGWSEIGAPPVLALATGYGETGAGLVANVDYVQFTGSARTGRAIAKQCAERLIPYSLELGGKDPALVLSDADLDRAVNGIATGGLANSGQICISIERVYVEEPIYDEFVDKLTKRVGEVRQGQGGHDFSHDIGAMATQNQSDIVQRHVDDAVAAGAHVAAGGKATGPGTFFEPTVLTDVDHSMSCMSEETFGPTLPVVKVADEAEAIRLANDSPYGLSATVWTKDHDRGERVARQLEVGAVNVNDFGANVFSFALPMGGWKESGVGARSGGANGILKYCRQQAITVPRIPPAKSELNWYPNSPRKLKIALGLMRATAGRGVRRFGMTPKHGR